MREPLTREQDLELQRNNGIKENAESDKQVMIWERDDLLKQLAEAQMVAMWTTEKPTVPGWYWYLPVGLPMRPKELFDYNGRLFIRGFEWLDNVTTSNGQAR